MTMTKGHVPEKNLHRYRKIKNIAAHLKRSGDMLSGMGEYADANSLWALEVKYRSLAQELRVDIPTKREAVTEYQDRPEYPKIYTGDDLSTVQVLMSGELFKAFEAWLVRNGLEVSPPMLFAADELPTYLILPPNGD